MYLLHFYITLHLIFQYKICIVLFKPIVYPNISKIFKIIRYLKIQHDNEERNALFLFDLSTADRIEFFMSSI